MTPAYCPTHMAARTAAVALLVLGMLAVAAPALAHAELVEASPADTEQLAEDPRDVVLTFTEPVTIRAGGIRVFDSDGSRVDAGNARSADVPEVVTVDLVDGLSPGTYVVTWRVTSADGHPIRGAYLFSVGTAGAADSSLLTELFSGNADRPYTVAAAIMRWLMYTGTLLAAGGAAFLFALRRETAVSRSTLTRIVGWAAAAGAVATLAGVLLQAALTTGLGVAAFGNAAILAETMGSPFGLSAAVRVLGLGMLAFVALRDYGPGWLGVGAAGAAGASLLLEGHTLTTDPRWLILLADGVHVAAAATWFGGLVLLAVALRQQGRHRDPIGTGRLVAGFSRMATTSIVAVIVAGLALGWLEVRAVRALTSTTYGWTLLVKTALFLPVVAAGVYNNRRLVPALTRARQEPARVADKPVPAGGSTEAPDVSGNTRAWSVLRRTLAIEVVALLAVLGATAVLVSLQPAAEAAGISGAYSTYVPLGDDWQLNLTVDPNRAGNNEIHMYVLEETGRQVEVEGDVALTLTLPEQDIGPIRRTPTRVGPGHFLLAGPELSLPGRWEITVEVPISRFEQASGTVPVVVNP